MEAIGRVYILDDHGRIRIPRYVRRRLNIQESDPLQIFIGDNNDFNNVFSFYKLFDARQ